MQGSKTPYQTWIAKALAAQGAIGIDPRHVEGYLLLDYGTLDSLDDTRLRRDLREIVPTVQADTQAAEALAASYGL